MIVFAIIALAALAAGIAALFLLAGDGHRNPSGYGDHGGYDTYGGTPAYVPVQVRTSGPAGTHSASYEATYLKATVTVRNAAGDSLSLALEGIPDAVIRATEIYVPRLIGQAGQMGTGLYRPQLDTPGMGYGDGSGRELPWTR